MRERPEKQLKNRKLTRNPDFLDNSSFFQVFRSRSHQKEPTLFLSFDYVSVEKPESQFKSSELSLPTLL
ncbi:MAG: hypothetical protein DI617_06365 [Streptococcus pyogenes]|nr:MAG: hypothetical protein DI617_06365 [Streptococcus pyogenes]